MPTRLEQNRRPTGVRPDDLSYIGLGRAVAPTPGSVGHPAVAIFAKGFLQSAVLSQ